MEQCAGAGQELGSKFQKELVMGTDRSQQEEASFDEIAPWQL